MHCLIMHILTHRKRACGPVVLFSLVAQVLALQIYDDLEVMSRNMHHGWEVLDGGTPLNDYVTAYKNPHNESTMHDNGVDRAYDGYSDIIAFGGYSGTSLCTRYNRMHPVDDHDVCPLERDWYQMWPPNTKYMDHNATCFIDDIRAYQDGNELDSPPQTQIRLGSCPANGTDPAYKWQNMYDWRYGGIRPQDNPDMALYPMVASYIEDKVKTTGKKVVVRGCSGGTINSYAFLMSQTEAWRQQHVMAYISMCPVFGGTISSLRSVISGWPRGVMTTCQSRMAAIFIPSVLWMWPRPGNTQWYWNSTEPIVYTPSKNYTAKDLPDLLTDMGLDKVRKLLELEINDYLMDFKPPMVDTYSFYGYGEATEAGFIFAKDITPEDFGEGKCPTVPFTPIARAFDNGDVTGPLRSTSRATAWADAHTKAKIVNKVFGYKGMRHSCDCTAPECTTMYTCVLSKLQGKPHTGC